MGTDRVVIVGSSVGGVRAAQALRNKGFEGEVILIGAEDVEPYDKPPLSKRFLAGDQDASDLSLMPDADWSGLDITKRLGQAAEALDLSNRHVELRGGERIGYDALILATGVRPKMIGETGDPLIHTIRELRESVSLRERLTAGSQIVVVGGGFIGSEVASTAAALGVKVTIVEALSTPFSRVLGATVGSLVAQLHADNGVEVITGAAVARVKTLGDDKGVVHLGDGSEIPASAVVVGIGCLPNTEWLGSSGLRIEDGVFTDEYCRAPGTDNVFAIGDVARWFDRRSNTHRRVEHWTNAVQQAQLVAHNIVNPDDRQANTKAPYFWSDQNGVKIQMVGRNELSDEVEVLRCDTALGKRSIALYSREQQLAAVVAFGWPQVIPKMRRAWEQGASLEEVRRLIETAAT